jgi:uncharacterized surface protein with fasciclin (FAS1) repeats
MKRIYFTQLIGSLLIIGIFILAGCKKNTTETVPTKPVSEVIAETPNLTILNAALLKTGLADTLRLARLYTIMAPSDSAFQAMPAPYNSIAGINGLGTAEVNALRTLLMYHVFYGKVNTFQLQTGLQTNRILTLNEGMDSLFFSKSVSRVVSVNGARVTEANREATYNGFIHIINKVLSLPTGNLIQTAAATANLKIVSAALTKTGLATDLSAAGPFTVFAPTDSAFTVTLKSLNGSITDETSALNFVNNTLSGSSTPNTTALANILRYHVINGRLYSNAIAADSLKTARTLYNNQTVAFTYPATGVVNITGAANGNQVSAVKTADSNTKNGVIHTINRVLLPQ